MAAAIAANPDMPVPTAATSVHPDPPPELPATAITVVTVGVAAITVVTGGQCGPGWSLAPSPPVQAPRRALGWRLLPLGVRQSAQ